MSALNVFIAGFQHETNTFAPTLADWAAFTRGESFPAFITGQPMVDRFAGGNIPMGGFIEAAREHGWALVPSCWAGATPSAHITDDAFERLCGFILGDLRREHAAGAIDAVYLDLHGAGVTQSHEDAEGELLRRVREVVGPDMPIVASLDLHANVTKQMLALADGLVAYRTYPHIDMKATGRLAARLLARRLAKGEREAMSVTRVPFLLPLNVQSTTMEPARSIYGKLVELDAAHDVMLSFATGFPAADIAEVGPTVFGYGEAAAQAVKALFDAIDEPRSQWRLELLSPADAVGKAMALAALASQPVVIADTQDNPGAGGDSNTTGMLHALLAAHAGRHFPAQVALGLLWDPLAAAAAHEAGVGATLDMSLGTSVVTFDGTSSEPPVAGRFTVRALHGGEVLMKGPMSGGQALSLGASACLEIDGVLVAVASAKSQMLDRELFRYLGIEPETMKVLVVKSSVHFRADFDPIASTTLVAKSLGPMSADPADLPWTRVPPEMALRP